MKRKVKRIAVGPSQTVRKAGRNVKSNHDGLGTSMPPDEEVLLIYFDQKGAREMAQDFFEEHEERDWKTPTGGIIHNWKVAAAEWLYNYRQEVKRKLRQSPFYSGSI